MVLVTACSGVGPLGKSSTSQLSTPLLASTHVQVAIAEGPGAQAFINTDGSTTAAPEVPYRMEARSLVAVPGGFARAVGPHVEIYDTSLRHTSSVALPNGYRPWHLSAEPDGSILVASVADDDNAELGLFRVFGRIRDGHYEHITVAASDSSLTTCPDGSAYVLESDPGTASFVGADGWALPDQPPVEQRQPDSKEPLT